VRSAEFVLGNVAEPAAVAEAMDGVDGCFHLAAVASVQRSVEAWMETHKINAGGTVCVLNASRARRVPVVFASSAAVYGSSSGLPMTEDVRPVPLTAYGADKLASELHAQVASNMFGVPTIGLRFFNVFGPRQDPRSPYSGVISIISDKMIRGEEVEIHGDGQQARDFIYVSDVVDFLRAAMARADTQARMLNVCTGRRTTIQSLAAALGELTGSRSRIRSAPARPGDIRESLGDPARAALSLGIEARIDLREGLRKTIRSLTELSAAA
jgi:UDP-glucose 4-epimerase